MIQNTLLAQYYTILHNYCEENGFPSPPPPMEEVIATWNRDFKPTQQEVESINCIARGKAVHQPMNLGDDRRGSSVTGLGLRNGVRNGLANRRASSQNTLSAQPVSPNHEARVMRIPSSNSIPTITAPEPSPSPEPVYSPPDYSSHLTPSSSYSAHSPAGPSADYFQRSSNAGAIQKKKPPPPPPKRIGSQNSGLYAVALYAFEGQSQGDLSFKEGDQIKIVKKTESTDDWWDGELRGVRGQFPANYCKLA
jgi:amphiphysin